MCWIIVLESFNKSSQEVNKLLRNTTFKDQKQQNLISERLNQEYDESERKLRNIIEKQQSVANRLNDHFRRKIESLNSHNMRTNEIKVQMNRYEDEK